MLKIKDKIKCFLDDDHGLIISWLNMFRASILTILLFVVIGKFIDAAYVFVYSNTSLYSTETIENFMFIYNSYSYIILIVLLMFIYYTINYAMWSQEDD